MTPKMFEPDMGEPPPRKWPQKYVRLTHDLAKSRKKSLGELLTERYLFSLTFAVQNSSLRSET